WGRRPGVAVARGDARADRGTHARLGGERRRRPHGTEPALALPHGEASHGCRSENHYECYEATNHDYSSTGGGDRYSRHAPCRPIRAPRSGGDVDRLPIGDGHLEAGHVRGRHVRGRGVPDGALVVV